MVRAAVRCTAAHGRNEAPSALLLLHSLSSRKPRIACIGGQHACVGSSTMHANLRSLLATMRFHALFALLLTASALAAEPDAGGCDAYEWDMNREMALLAGAPIALPAWKARAEDARFTPLDRRLQVSLHPTGDVRLLTPPGRAHDPATSHAGLLLLYVPRSAAYRISSDQRLWIDVVGPTAVVKSSRFAMQAGCSKLVKSVAFKLEPEIGYWIQLTGSPAREAMLLITLDR